jgi:hypothetical protein
MLNNSYQFFSKNQDLLLNYVNTEEGRDLLGIKEKFPIIRLMPSGFTFGEGKYRLTKVYGKEKIGDILLPIFEQIKIANEYEKVTDFDRAFWHFAGYKRDRFLPRIFLTNYNSQSGDGWVGYTIAAGTAWATIHDAVNGNAVNYAGADDGVGIYVHGTDSNKWKLFRRPALEFNTNDLGIADVTAASVFASVLQAGDNWASSICAAGFTPANPAGLVNGDYNDFGTVSFGSITIASLPLAYGTFKEIAFNADGLAYVKKTTYTSIGIRISDDLNNVQPSPRAVNNMAQIGIQFSESANVPYFSVTSIARTVNYLKYYRRTRFPGPITGIDS